MKEEENKPSREEAEEAVRTLIKWTGYNPDREGLIETPKRVVKAFEEYFSGYNLDPRNILEKTFSIYVRVLFCIKLKVFRISNNRKYP